MTPSVDARGTRTPEWESRTTVASGLGARLGFDARGATRDDSILQRRSRFQSVAPPSITVSISSSLNVRLGGSGRGNGMGGGLGRDIVNPFPSLAEVAAAFEDCCMNA